MVCTGLWDDEHLPVLRENYLHADVVYTRWRNAAGHEFPFSPYDRAAHLGGLNFVGTDVCLSPRAVALYTKYTGSVDWCLRELAQHDDITFLGVDAVTYTRRRPC